MNNNDSSSLYQRKIEYNLFLENQSLCLCLTESSGVIVSWVGNMTHKFNEIIYECLDILYFLLISIYLSLQIKKSLVTLITSSIFVLFYLFISFILELHQRSFESFTVLKIYLSYIGPLCSSLVHYLCQTKHFRFSAIKPVSCKSPLSFDWLPLT